MEQYQNPDEDSKMMPSSLLIQIFNSPSMQQHNLESVHYIKNDRTLKSNSVYFDMLLKNSNDNSTFRRLKICEITNARTTKIFIPGIPPCLVEMVIKMISAETEIFRIISKVQEFVFGEISFLETPDLFFRVFDFFQLKSKCMDELDRKVCEYTG